MTNDGRTHKAVIFYEYLDVICHGFVVMARVVRRVAMVSKVLESWSSWSSSELPRA